MSIREKIQQNEKLILSEHAMLSVNTVGRLREEPPCEFRTPFQRDRDRILHSNSFKRLKRKTQVYISPLGDHYRTRLTHTLEVSQIARTIARALSLNEDLTEAVALGHDIGHTPFGHAGERALKEVSDIDFRHGIHSGRVADVLEKHLKGLNLTRETISGMVCHTTALNKKASTLEGRVVQFADRIAYVNHDIEDSIRAGILKESQIPADIISVLGSGKSPRITTLVKSVIENSDEDIKMDEEIQNYFEKLYKFLYKNVYTNPKAKGEESKAEDVVKRIFTYYTSNADKLPEEYHLIYEREGSVRAAVDFVASMTDPYILQLYSDLFIPKSWSVL